MSHRRIGLVSLIACLAAAPAFAQSHHRAEAGVSFGYTFSDGVSGDNFIAGDGNTYNRVDPKDSGSWGLSFGFFVNPNVEVGFHFGQQLSKAVISGPTTSREVGDLTINSYHPYFAYNFGDEDAKVRPYASIGLGATNFGAVNYTKVNGTPGSTTSQSQFSTSWEFGVKMYPNPKFGIKAAMQWNPTYIKTDATGVWCDPYWGCFTTGNAQYANQFQLLGGFLVRF